jgi:2-polyprenyl-3-methyl-5-hydroxy-6-metoxy-1,4-benzoquinol methylase
METLRRVLARLAAEPTAELSDEDAAPLLAEGLVEPVGGFYALTHGVRLRGERPYLMTRGEYRQDIWPETDSLLDLLESVSPGRLLDMGTGTGILAVEAALRGHRVVATDIYKNTLELARFNARLNGIDNIDFRLGHLFEPARGEQFDLIVTVPHYTRACDQLRLETLRTGLDLVAPGGRLVVATPLEWERDQIPVVETLLRPMVERGASVTIQPIVSDVKRHWFTRAEGVPGLVSRHRFLITVEPAGGRLRVERPRDHLTEHFVPLSRLRLDGSAESSPRGPAVFDDAARLRELLAGLARGHLTLSGALPTGLLDACRFNRAPCVSLDRADGPAGAILDLDGNVRPCTHGGPIGRVDDSLASLLAKQRQRWIDTGVRRGCDTCEARTWCPRCLFPGALSEADYCDLMRASGATLPLLHRLLRLLPRIEARHLQVKLPPPPLPSAQQDARMKHVAARLGAMSCWILIADESRYCLASLLADGSDWLLDVDSRTAGAVESLLAGGVAPDDILESLGGA